MSTTCFYRQKINNCIYLFINCSSDSLSKTFTLSTKTDPTKFLINTEIVAFVSTILTSVITFLKTERMD